MYLHSRGIRSSFSLKGMMELKSKGVEQRKQYFSILSQTKTEECHKQPCPNYIISLLITCSLFKKLALGKNERRMIDILVSLLKHFINLSKYNNTILIHIAHHSRKMLLKWVVGEVQLNLPKFFTKYFHLHLRRNVLQ